MAKNVSASSGLPVGLRERAQGIQDAYAKGDVHFFDFLAEDCTVYSVGTVQPFSSRAEYREYFEPILTQTTRRIKILKQDVKMMDSRCLVLKTMSITQGEITANVRQSSIWIESSEGWKLEHLHNALIGTPSPTSISSDVNVVTTLNEKIATVVATLGVAQ